MPTKRSTLAQDELAIPTPVTAEENVVAATLRPLGPTLAVDTAEAMRMVAGGRQDISLRESKHFDSERLATMPLFDRRLF